MFDVSFYNNVFFRKFINNITNIFFSKFINNIIKHDKKKLILYLCQLNMRSDI